MIRTTSILSTFGLGAGFAWLFDRESGRRRRAMLVDQSRHGFKVTSRGLQKGARDLSHRTRGLLAGARRIVDREEALDDVIEARVRSRIGRLAAHPHAVRVSVLRGVVTLSGDVLPSDAHTLLTQLPKVRGVQHVEDRFAVHCAPEHVSSLQGGRRTITRSDRGWPPGIRLAVVGACAIAKPFAWRSGGVVGKTLFVAAGLLATRALINRPFSRALGFGGRRLIQLHKTIEIDAPIDQVFAYWDNVAHFPEFMSHVRDVRDLGNGRSHWTVSGPFGVPVSWTAETSAYRPNEILAWRSADGSLVKHSGIVLFESWGDGTKLEIEMTYNPPGGLLGHAFAWLFRTDPKHALDDDMARLKTLLEIGKTSVGHQPVIQSEAPLLH